MMQANDKVNHRLIKQFQCKKLSHTASGSITYDLWQHQDDGKLHLALSANDSAGCFSAELIAVNQVLVLLKTLQADNKPFFATALKPLFVGKSANNASFLAAALLDQGVIQFNTSNIRLLEVKSDVEQWPERLQQLLQVDTSLKGKPHSKAHLNHKQSQSVTATTAATPINLKEAKPHETD